MIPLTLFNWFHLASCFFTSVFFFKLSFNFSLIFQPPFSVSAFFYFSLAFLNFPLALLYQFPISISLISRFPFSNFCFISFQRFYIFRQHFSFANFFLLLICFSFLFYFPSCDLTRERYCCKRYSSFYEQFWINNLGDIP